MGILFYQAAGYKRFVSSAVDEATVSPSQCEATGPQAMSSEVVMIFNSIKRQ